jgi:hypothetical protein
MAGKGIDGYNPMEVQKIEPVGGWNASKPKMGRPSKYSDELALSICDRLADGESLKAMCEDDGMPTRSTIFKWLAENKHFSDMYTRAREEQADALFDEIIAISDDGTNDWMEKKGIEGENIGWLENGEALRRSALRIDARKWAAAKLLPRKYSEKFQVDANHSGTVGVTFYETKIDGNS